MCSGEAEKYSPKSMPYGFDCYRNFLVSNEEAFTKAVVQSKVSENIFNVPPILVPNIPYIIELIRSLDIN